jgi:hypothetical protein
MRVIKITDFFYRMANPNNYRVGRARLNFRSASAFFDTELKLFHRIFRVLVGSAHSAVALTLLIYQHGSGEPLFRGSHPTGGQK